jgi:hypothetical protein
MNIAKRGLFVALSGFLTLAVYAQKNEVPKGWHLLNPKDSGYYESAWLRLMILLKRKN